MATIGRDVLVTESTDGGTTWTAIAAGERSNEITINGEAIDLTDKSSGGWRILDTRASQLSVDLSMSGTLKDAKLIERIMANGDSLTFNLIQLDVGFGVFEGSFYMSGITLTNEHTDATVFEASFQSAGVVEFTAA